MTMTDIYLIRHGATALNRCVPYRLQGRQSDPPLDPVGIAQARAAARVLERVRPRLAAVYTSPLRRATATAQLVAEPLGVEPVPVAELTEADVGRWEGRTWEEIAASEPDEYRRFMADPGTVPYPSGESFRDVQRRALPALLRLAKRHPGQAIGVIGHNVVNRAILAEPLGIPIARARGLRLHNGGISVLTYEDGTLRVLTLNAAFHLAGLDGQPDAGPGTPAVRE
jgi:broad specificity phosphatase PhoE